ncbi:MAG: hypothetical protein WKF66_14385 [Pedobacter sp.]
MTTKSKFKIRARALSLVVLMVTFGSSALKAQKTVNQGTLTYDITYDLNEGQKKTIDAEKLPSVTKVKFNGNMSKMEIDMGLATLKMIVDGPGKLAVLLVDAPLFQKQYAAKFSKEDLEKQGGNLTFKNFKATGVRQIIGGYDAVKYNYQDNNNENYEVWIAPELKLSPGAILPEFSGLKGTPVKYVSLQYGVKNILTLKSVKEEKTGPFTLEVPSGYEVKTVKEMDEMFRMLNGPN